jgi:hypothetical protein
MRNVVVFLQAQEKACSMHPFPIDLMWRLAVTDVQVDTFRNTPFADQTSTRTNALFVEGAKVDTVRNHGYSLIKGLIVFIPQSPTFNISS